MKAIITRRNADGSFDKVGMNNRTISGPLKTTDMLRHRAFTHAEAGKSKGTLIEFYHGDNIYGVPFMVEEWALGDDGAWLKKQRLARA